MFLGRKLGVQLVEGNPDTLAEAKTPYVAHLRDQLDKYKIRIDENQCISGTLIIDGDDSEYIPLPDGYVSGQPLAVIISTEDLIKVTLEIDVLEEEFVVRGESGNGGLFSCCQALDAVKVTNGTSNPITPITIEYTAYQLPDLSKPESWAIGYLATGTVPI